MDSNLFLSRNAALYGVGDETWDVTSKLKQSQVAIRNTQNRAMVKIRRSFFDKK